MPHLTIAKNTFYQVFARAATSFIGFLITIIIARKFGVLGYGDFTKVTSFVALFYLVLDFGLNAFFLQYEKANFKNLFYLRILISLIVFTCLNLIALLLPYNSVLNSGFSENARIGIFIFSFIHQANLCIVRSCAPHPSLISMYFKTSNDLSGN